MPIYNGFAGGRGGVPPNAVHLETLTTGDILRWDATNDYFYNTPLTFDETIALTQLSDVTISSATNTQFLRYNGSQWVNASVTLGSTTLAGLTDVTLTTPLNTHYLKYDGSKWVNAAGTGGVAAFDDLNDVAISAPAAGHLVAYNNGANWANTSAPRITTIELGAASDTTISRASAGVIAVEGKNVYMVGGANVALTDGGTGADDAAGARTALGLTTGQIWVPAASMWITTTNGALAQSLVELTSNDTNVWVVDFEDTAIERAEFTIAMPVDWDAGNVTTKFYWMVNSTQSNSVVWRISGVVLNDNTAVDTITGTAVSVTDANGGAANRLRITAATAAIPFGGGTPAAGSLIHYRVTRNGTSGSDDLTATARLLGTMLTYTKI